MRLWREVLTAGKRKAFSPSIRFSVVRAIQLSSTLPITLPITLPAPPSPSPSQEEQEEEEKKEEEEGSVRWWLALLSIEFLQDDDEEVREAINHYLCTSVLPAVEREEEEKEKEEEVSMAITVEVRLVVAML